MRRLRPIIAIVDDEESVRRALSRLLRASGLDTRTYSCGLDFLNAVNDCRFDCVVADIHMPRLSGFDVLAAFARTGVNIPVILITGRDSEETRQRAMEAGPVTYLLKPVDEGSLLSAVENAIAPPEGRSTGSSAPPKSANATAPTPDADP